jgi:cytochrome c oxidase cbb3-type subunit 2
MTPQTYRPDGKTFLAAVTTVAAVYVYFLIFAQFGFLKAVQAALGETAGAIRPVMAVMGLAGIAGSGLAAWIFTEPRSRRLLLAGFAVCAAAALGSTQAQSMGNFQVVALLTGLGTGLVTVTLAGMLRRAVGDGCLGLIIGLGTGLAYAFCNLPAVFAAGAISQTQVALLAVVAGLVGGLGLKPRVGVDRPADGDYSRGGVVAWGLVFFALVGLDSAAFYIIQHNPALKEVHWSGSGRLILNAGIHLGAAVLAGWALDRGRPGRTIFFGAGALVGACLLLEVQATAGWLYVTGVSVYSVVLVYYPARSGRPGVAALVYAVAGWGGSGLGIALAEGRTTLPAAATGGAFILLALGLLGRRLASRQG